MKRARKGAPRKRFIFGHLTAKLMALALAAALWFYAHYSSLEKTTFRNVSTRIATSEGWTVDQPRSGKTFVKATLSYPRRIRDEVQQAVDSGEIHLVYTAVPDDPGSDDQQRAVSLADAELVVPATWSLRTGGFDPERIDVRLVREDTVSLTVEIRVSAPQQGYEVADKRATPREVDVIGPKGILAHATKIGTEEVDITDRDDTDWGLSPITVAIADYVEVDGRRYPVSCDAQVQCHIKIIPRPKVRTFAKVPIDLLIPADYPYTAKIYSTSARTASVTVSGPPQVVKELTADNLRLFVDVGDLKPNPLAHKPPIQYHFVSTTGSGKLVVEKIDPVYASIEVGKKPSE